MSEMSGRVLHVGLSLRYGLLIAVALIFITTAVAYWSIRGFGPQAQAGYGIGARVMQAIFLPAMAVAFATGPIGFVPLQ